MANNICKAFFFHFPLSCTFTVFLSWTTFFFNFVYIVTSYFFEKSVKNMIIWKFYVNNIQYNSVLNGEHICVYACVLFPVPNFHQWKLPALMHLADKRSTPCIKTAQIFDRVIKFDKNLNKSSHGSWFVNKNADHFNSPNQSRVSESLHMYSASKI